MQLGDAVRRVSCGKVKTCRSSWKSFDSHESWIELSLFWESSGHEGAGMSWVSLWLWLAWFVDRFEERKVQSSTRFLRTKLKSWLMVRVNHKISSSRSTKWSFWQASVLTSSSPTENTCKAANSPANYNFTTRTPSFALLLRPQAHNNPSHSPSSLAPVLFRIKTSAPPPPVLRLNILLLAFPHFQTQKRRSEEHIKSPHKNINFHHISGEHIRIAENFPSVSARSEQHKA